MINKNANTGSYREVYVLGDKDDANLPKLLTDLSNSSEDISKKVIASIFLRARKSVAPIQNDPTANTTEFLVLKPECLWLRASGTTIVDIENKTRSSIAVFDSYVADEKIKIFYLSRPFTVTEILTNQGITGIDNIHGIKNVFVYDLNALNRTRSASINAVGNAALNSIWL